jgi:hypothetical protein
MSHNIGCDSPAGSPTALRYVGRIICSTVFNPQRCGLRNSSRAYATQDRGDQSSTPVPEHILRSLVACLPPRPQAVWLCELYLDFPGYFRAFNRQEMVEEVFTKLYDNEDRINHLQPRPHLLAVIFFIFAIAATFDRSVPSDNDAAKTYFRLGNQCLDLRCLGSSNDLESVQAIALLSQFQSMTPEREQSDGAWFYGSMAVKLATKVRLHQQDASSRLTTLQQIGLRMS